MPTYLTDTQLWNELWPVPVVSLLLSAVVALILRGKDGSFVERWLPMAAVTTLGLVIGQMTGQSREPVLASTIGAVLTLMGGAFLYLVSTRKNDERLLASGAIFALSLSLLLGANWGASLRQQFDDYRTSSDYELRREIDQQDLKDKRQLLGLPEPEHAASNP